MNYNNIFISLLDALNVKYTRSFSNKYYNEHPHKNNMYGLSGMLSEYGIENQGFRIKDKDRILKELEVPFLAKLNNDFVVVYDIDDTNVGYIWKDKKVSVPIDDFKNRWSGVLLLMEPNENSIEPDYINHRKAEIIHFMKNALLVLACALMLVIIGLNTKIYIDLYLVFAILINIVGAYVCYLLVLKQVYIQNNYADKICSLLNNSSDCNNILESDASRIFGFSWSEIGLGYFIGNILMIIIMPSLYPYVAWINVCVLPYTLWSIWYQKFKAKQWCLLCLIIQGLLWMLFFYNLFTGLMRFPRLNFQDILLIMCVYIIPVLFLNKFNSILSEAKNKEKVSQELNNLKSNEQLFNMLIKEKQKFEVDKSTSTILLGNPESDNLITIVSNPHCNPCAQLHKKVKHILKNKANECCIQYIFSSFDRKLEDSSRFILSMYQKLDKRDFLLFLDEWYTYGRYDRDKIFQKYRYNNSANEQTEFDKHKAWITQTKIMATPTILFKGYELPSQIYKIEDLLLLSGIKIS